MKNSLKMLLVLLSVVLFSLVLASCGADSGEAISTEEQASAADEGLSAEEEMALKVEEELKAEEELDEDNAEAEVEKIEAAVASEEM